MLNAQHLAGAAQAGLDLVGDEQNVLLLAHAVGAQRGFKRELRS